MQLFRRTFEQGIQRFRATLMEYYWDTIEASVASHIVVEAMEEVGLERVTASRSVGGLVMDYLAIKPVTPQLAI